MADSPLVYSTEHGRLCPDCGMAIAKCICKSAAQSVKGTGTIRVGRETKGRAGKGVTVVSGLPLDGIALASLAKELKQRCATGGTVRDGVIEIQGDMRDLIVAELVKRGYAAKKSG